MRFSLKRERLSDDDDDEENERIPVGQEPTCEDDVLADVCSCELTAVVSPARKDDGNGSKMR